MSDEWRSRAACKGKTTKIFFPPGGTGSDWPAMQVCDRCPVRIECRDEGRAEGEWGIWGGEGQRARQRAGVTLRDRASEHIARYHQPLPVAEPVETEWDAALRRAAVATAQMSEAKRMDEARTRAAVEQQLVRAALNRARASTRTRSRMFHVEHRVP